MAKSFAVMGLGRFGTSTALTLARMGHEVLVIDKQEDCVSAVKDQVLRAVVGDTTDERVLQQLGVRNFDCIVVCYGVDLRASILTTVLCREMGAKYIVAKAHDDLHAKLLAKTGADRVIQPEHDGGVRLARSLASEIVIDSLDLTDDYSLNEMRVPPSWVGQTLLSLDLRRKTGVSVVALRRGERVSVNVDPHDSLQAGDVVFVVGDNQSLSKLQDV